MDFYAVLDQVVALLRSRGRVSYRVLKRQFALDDELLADLTAELRYAHYPIAEDHDQGLVRTGERRGKAEDFQQEVPVTAFETAFDLRDGKGAVGEPRRHSCSKAALTAVSVSASRAVTSWFGSDMNFENMSSPTWEGAGGVARS